MLHDQLPRSRWKLGKIICLFPGSDGVVRAAKVKCQGAELKRSIERLYPLELSGVQDDAPKRSGIVLYLQC